MSAEPVKGSDGPLGAPQSSQAAEQATAAAASAPTVTQNPPEPESETAPDPDEDDLSDLDDVLDEFAATNISKPAPASSGPGRPALPPAAGAAAPSIGGGAGPGGLFADEDEFAKAIQAGMAGLLGEFEANPGMQKQFEDLVKELGEGMGSIQGETGLVPEIPPAAAGAGAGAAVEATAASSSTSGTSTITAKAADSASASKPAAPTAAAAASFEDTIRATMERMSASNTAASDAASKSAAAGPEEDFLAAMLREMEKEGGAGGLGSDEDFSKMLMGMMDQLTNKEILYEPMKELHDKFPMWMNDNEGKAKKEDWERYKEQQRLVGEIVGKFEEKDYLDGKVEYREFIVERMQQMQAAGSPPPDLVGDMDTAQEALSDLDTSCPQQ